MLHRHSIYIPIYEGEEDPRQHWFIYERMWDAANIKDEDKQIAPFSSALRKRALTWYMNFTENQIRTKDRINSNFLVFLKKEDIAHLATQILKDIKQVLGKFVQEYDKRLKDLLSQISLNIDANLLIQWYIISLLQHVRSPLRMHNIKSLEEAFKKV